MNSIQLSDWLSFAALLISVISMLITLRCEIERCRDEKALEEWEAKQQPDLRTHEDYTEAKVFKPLHRVIKGKPTMGCPFDENAEFNRIEDFPEHDDLKR